jgi:hypothetical protein
MNRASEKIVGVAGVGSTVRLSSPPAILHQVPMRLIGLVLALSLALAPLAADAQQAGKVHRIGVVSLGAAPTRR